ncbi:MAG: trypsin-like peptidase domain-containing protein [Yoonia sp.]|nr:trypsin-like peptidase domain-containing protein [Yoonia sp.]
MIRALTFFFILALSPVTAIAQNTVWVQVEAQPTLSTAQARARVYAGQLENVNGYFLGGRWYGVVLGPYTPNDAEALLAALRRSGQIPNDSYIVDGSRFRQQFYPVGVGAQTAAQPLPATIASAPLVDEVVAAPEVEAPVIAPPIIEAPVVDPVQAPDETAKEAQASEALLDRAQRMDLQVALQWAGFYTSAIDGAYGRGTRASMRAWQEANNHEPTGILTTRQRAALLTAYNAVLEGMDLQVVRDDASGIEIMIPTGVVSFSEYEPPFVRFDAKGEIDAKVLLISQEGDQNRLYGLYEILQTLAIVPTEGARSRDKSSFELEGIGDGIHSYTYAKLDDGNIKGFSLIWPEGDDERRRRILGEMKASFVTLEGVLDPSLATPSEDQAIDLIGGLAVRKPQMSRSGFYIDDQGSVLTTMQAVQSCESITIDGEHDMSIVHSDEALGIAVLRPQDKLAPQNVALFQTGVPRLQAEVAVAGYPYGGVLVTPSLTFGRLADLRGLNGEENVKRLSLTAQEGDAGGPVFDNGGAVLGMLLPRASTNGQVLPPEVSFALDADQILTSLQAAGISVLTTDTMAFMPPETLTLRAAENTVLVSCW